MLFRSFISKKRESSARDNKIKRIVFYKGKEVNENYEIDTTCKHKFLLTREENESFIEFEYYPENEEFHICKLKVHPLCRRKGYGVALIRAALLSEEGAISRVTLKACAEKDDSNELKEYSDYTEPLSQIELVKYYEMFYLEENGNKINFTIS